MASVRAVDRHIATIEETQRLAVEVARAIRPGMLLALSGELGSGKTTFTRLLCQTLGVTVPISSPTYVLSHEYPTDSGYIVEHWDLYRARELPAELEEDFPQGVRIIEWAERFPSLNERASINIAFTLLEDGSRKARCYSR